MPVLSAPLVIVHAHPDDETLSSGALILAMATLGVRVHVLTATRGERGEVTPGLAAAAPDADALTRVRERELARACALLGVARHAFLGQRPARAAGRPPRRYVDSGMRWLDTDQTQAGPAADAGPDSLTRAAAADVADDIAAYAAAIGAAGLVTYDEAGGYGHPDHVFLHAPTHAAASRLGLPFYELVSPGRPAHPDDIAFEVAPERIAHVLRAFASQLTVTDRDLVHVGGQRQPLPARTVVRPAGRG